MKFLKVASWEEYQHYKDRCPPWIKLHFSILSSQTWVMLSDASKLLAISCMLIASRNEGRVPSNPDYVKRVAYLDDLPDFEPLIKQGFLVEVQADASICKQSQAKDTTEKRREEKRREDNTPSTDVDGDVKNEFKYPKSFMTFWEIYPKRVNKGAAFKAFKRISASEYPAVRAGLERKIKCADWQRDGGKYIPHASTWLNARGWEDEDISGNNSGVKDFMRRIGA